MSFSSAVASWAVTYPYCLLTIALVLVFVGLTTVQDSRRNSGRLPYPPGPKGYPFIGSLLEAPTEKPWLTYAEWGETYGEQLGTPGLRGSYQFLPGDMVFFKVLGQPILILNSVKRTNDLFEKRSSNYSDRKSGIMLIEL